MTLRTTTNRAMIAALAAAAMVAFACASEADPLEAIPTTTAAPATSEAPATTSSTVPEPTACEDPSAEYLGDGRYRRDGSVYEMTEVGCLFRPNRPDDSDVVLDDASVLDGVDTSNGAQATVAAEQVCVDDVCVDVPADGSPLELPEGFANHEHPPETEPGYEPGPGTEEPVAPDEPERPGAESDETASEAEATTTTAAPEPEPVATTTTAPEPEPVATTSTSVPEPEPVTTAAAPEPGPVVTTTAPPVDEGPRVYATAAGLEFTTWPLPAQVGETIYLVDVPTGEQGCIALVGCFEPVHLRVGSVMVLPEWPEDRVTVVALEDKVVHHAIWVCWFDASHDRVRLHRLTAPPETPIYTDGIYRIGGNLSDYYREC